MKHSTPKWLLRSRAYQKAKNSVAAVISSPERLIELVKNAQSKALRNAGGKLGAVIEPTTTAFRLLKAYASGDYREVSTETILLLVASIIYFVMPFDVIPDILVGLGFADDAALLAWTLRSVSDDLKRFEEWEKHEYEVVEGEIVDE